MVLTREKTSQSFLIQIPYGSCLCLERSLHEVVTVCPQLHLETYQDKDGIVKFCVDGSQSFDLGLQSPPSKVVELDMSEDVKYTVNVWIFGR